jgi:hypothetical protein
MKYNVLAVFYDEELPRAYAVQTKRQTMDLLEDTTLINSGRTLLQK